MNKNIKVYHIFNQKHLLCLQVIYYGHQNIQQMDYKEESFIFQLIKNLNKLIDIYLNFIL